MAEAMFIHLAQKRGILHAFDIDSAGTGGWHVGEPPDPRMREVAAQHDIAMSCRARQVAVSDFSRFDMLICMDEENHDRVQTMGAPLERLHLLMQFHPDPPTMEVPDPYFGGHDGFQNVFTLVQHACEGLLDHLLAQRNIDQRSNHD